MPDINLSFSFRLIVLLLAAVFSVVAAMFVYRFTVPPISASKRSILVSLRSSGLFLLILLLGEPLLSLITHFVNPPVAVILVDDSQSMSINDRKGKRDESLKKIFESDVWKQINKKGSLSYLLFNGKVRGISEFSKDSLTQKGEATDISEALKSVKRLYGNSNLQAVILITDGNSTVGINPLYEAEDLEVPVFSIGIGDTSEQKDLLVRKILSNEIAYAGTKVPVNVTVHSAGSKGERVFVSLRNGAAKLDEKNLLLESGIRDYLVPLMFIPDKEGIQKLTVEVTPIPGELTTQNNRMSFFIKCLKSKLRIALIAGAPSQDAAFIRRALESNKNYEVKSYFEQKNGQFDNILSAQSLNEIDCVVLVGYPTNNTNINTFQLVIDVCSADKPMLFLLSRTMDHLKLQSMNFALPFRVDNITNIETQMFVAVSEIMLNHPILKTNNANTSDVWSKLPPVFRTQGIFRPKIESEVLAYVRLQSGGINEPFIIVRKLNKNKSVAVLGYGLWRWTMLSDAETASNQVLENFLGNSIRWLTTQEDSRRVRVQSSKRTYTTQEAIEFSAQVYDENYQPIDNAQIEVRSQRDSDANPLILNPSGNGQYQGIYDRLLEGEYKYTATVQVDGKIIGTDQGVFAVGGLNAEYLETRMNKTLLQQIADQTGGRYYEIDQIESLSNDITNLHNFRSQEISKSSEIEIWNSKWMVLLLIAIFALEWFLRKRNGML